MTAAAARLTTHVLDTARGCPATGVRIDVSAIDADGRARLLATATTNAEGRTDAPLLGGDAMTPGRYEIAFHIGAYFRRLANPAAGALFLDVVPVRFTIADARVTTTSPSSSRPGATPPIGAADVPANYEANGPAREAAEPLRA